MSSVDKKIDPIFVRNTFLFAHKIPPYMKKRGWWKYVSWFVIGANII
jgi:hypothetical protein